MDITTAWQAFRRQPRLFATLTRTGLIACIPVIGSIVLAAYALRFTRAAAVVEDRPSSGLRLDLHTIVVGLKCQLLTVGATLAAGLITLPLWVIDRSAPTATSGVPTTLLIESFHGPTALLTTVVMTLIVALSLARFAATGSAMAVLDIAGSWALLRAQPSLWVATALLGFLIADAPLTLVLLLPLSNNVTVPVALLATALLAPATLIVQAHLIGQAFALSAHTIARRRPLIVRVRW